MTLLKWWMRVIGSLYMLLAMAGLYASFANPALYAGGLPAAYSGDPLAVRASIDADFVPMFGWLVLGAVVVWFSRMPAQARSLATAMIALELFQCIPVDIVWYLRGFPNVAPFIVLHLAFGVSGWIALRRATT